MSRIQISPCPVCQKRLRSPHPNAPFCTLRCAGDWAVISGWAELARARAALEEMVTLLQRSIRSNGVGRGSYLVSKWNGQEAIYKARTALGKVSDV